LQPKQLSFRIFTGFDNNLDGIVDLNELICGMAILLKGKLEVKLKVGAVLFLRAATVLIVCSAVAVCGLRPRW
jgi:hypothetical protein